VRLSNYIRIRFEEVSDRSEDGGPGGRVSRRQLSDGDGKVKIHASGSREQEDHLARPKVGSVPHLPSPGSDLGWAQSKNWLDIVKVKITF